MYAPPDSRLANPVPERASSRPRRDVTKRPDGDPPARKRDLDKISSALEANAQATPSPLLAPWLPGALGSIVRRMPAVLVTASLATAVTVARAEATSPTSTEESFHRTVPFITCDGVAVTHESDITRRDTTFTDQSGTATRIVIHIRFKGTLTNPETGRSVRDNGSFQRTIDRSDGSSTVTGGFRVISAPREGVLLHQTGRGVLLNGQGIFQAGPNEFNEQEFDRLCAYLAG